MRQTQYLFVYGTLRRNRELQIQHPFLDRCDYLSIAVIRGELYKIADYPGAVTGGHALIKGELYLMQDPQQTLSLLDDYEECAEHFPQPHEYIRLALPATMPDGISVSAWVYLYNRPVNELMRIHSGDYLNYLQEHS